MVLKARTSNRPLNIRIADTKKHEDYLTISSSHLSVKSRSQSLSSVLSCLLSLLSASIFSPLWLRRPPMGALMGALMVALMGALMVALMGAMENTLM